MMTVVIAAGAEPVGCCSRNGISITVISRASVSAGITEYAFQDAAIEVGDTLTWTNNGNEPHSVTSDTGVFGSVTLNPKASYSFQFNQTGDFPYHCSIHGFMKSNVRVVAPGSPSITSSLVLNTVAGMAFSYTIASKGTAPLTFSATGLPSGLTLSDATISGTPTAGNFQVVLNASNAIGQDSQTLNLTVTQTPIFLSPSAVSVQVGAPFSYTIDATGTAPLNYFASSLPPGLVFSGNTISGSVATTGIYVASLSVAGGGASASQSLTISVLVSQTLITSHLTCTGKTGVLFSYRLTSSDAAAVFSTGLLPRGLTFSRETIIGVPTTAGSFAVALTAQTATAIDNQILTVTVLDMNNSDTKVDSDGNGVPDEMQVAVGQTPALGAPESLTISELSIKLNFASVARDAISLSGSLGISKITAGSTFVVDIGGVVQVFTMDAKGNAVQGRNRLKVSLPKSGAAKFSWNLQGTFSPLLIDEKLTNSNVSDLPLTVPIAIVVNNTLFSANVGQKYSASSGKTGRTTIVR